MTWPTVLLLALQAVLAAAGLHLLVRCVLPRLGLMTHAGIVTDVWGPLVLAGPMCTVAARVTLTVRGPGWLSIGAPIGAGAAIVGAALAGAIVTRAGWPRPAQERGPDAPLSNGAASACWAGAGVLLLLLAAANELTVWTGQCVFAVAAMLLWISTPSHHAGRGATTAAADHAAGVALLGALACAVGQGVVALLLPADALGISGGLMVAGALVGGGGAIAVAGSDRAARLGGWTAALGSLFGVGLLSICHLLPSAFRIITERGGPAPRSVARGFGAYGIEAVLLLALPIAFLAAPRLSRPVRIAVGLGLLGAALATIGWRLTTI